MLCSPCSSSILLLLQPIDNVHFQQSAQLIEALVNRNVQFRLQVRHVTISLLCSVIVHDIRVHEDYSIHESSLGGNVRWMHKQSHLCFRSRAMMWIVFPCARQILPNHQPSKLCRVIRTIITHVMHVKWLTSHVIQILGKVLTIPTSLPQNMDSSLIHVWKQKKPAKALFKPQLF